jgi:cytidylate kinase
VTEAQRAELALEVARVILREYEVICDALEREAGYLNRMLELHGIDPPDFHDRAMVCNRFGHDARTMIQRVEAAA